MPTSERKRRELQAREELFLDTASRFLAEQGPAGLSMERIAEATEFSKGTVYQHFSCKEDLLAHLVARLTRIRHDLFSRAAEFEGRPRERMAAIGAAYDLIVLLYPDHYRAAMYIREEELRTKCSPAALALMSEEDRRCDLIMGRVVEDAVAAGDLPAADPDALAEIQLGLWAVTWGAYSILFCGAPLEERGFPDPLGALRRNQDRLLDGYGWRPLSSEWDYEAARRRALAEVFPAEARQVGLLDASARN